MELTDETFHLVKNTPKVTGFLVLIMEQNLILFHKKKLIGLLIVLKKHADGPRPSVIFEIGEQVRVSEGPFASFNGLLKKLMKKNLNLKLQCLYLVVLHQ